MGKLNTALRQLPSHQSNPVRLRGRDFLGPGRFAINVIDVRDESGYRPHLHDFVELVLIRSGSGIHQNIYGTQRLCAGQVLVLLPGDWHGYRDCQGLHYTNLILGVDFLKNELGWSRHDPCLARLLWTGGPGEKSQGPQVYSFDHREALRLAGHYASIRKLRLLPASTENHCLVLSRVAEILAMLASQLRPEPRRRESRPAHIAVLRSIELLEKRLEETWTLPGIARAVRLHPSYLIRLFRQQTGLAPMAYLRRLRLERAGALLLFESQRVAEVQAKAGFVDSAHFSRAFKNQFGLSPRAFRLLHVAGPKSKSM